MTTIHTKSNFYNILMSRGFIKQCTDTPVLDERLNQNKPISAYIGFDATADSLHVGSLIQIMMLRCLQKCGHRPIILMGGGTTKVGDPSGKDETRQLLNTEIIDKNIQGIRAVFAKYIKFDDSEGKGTAAIQPNNADWLDELNYVEFLRDIGRHFTINKMMTMESVKSRLDREQPLTFLEFNYMLLQSYDFLQLHKREGCELQIGGSDQWGNIVNGIDLVRRVDGAQVFGLTSHLLTKADGSKMGKTASGAIWLDSDKTSPYDFWQFWRNTMDEDVGKFLKLFTELPIEKCDELGELWGQDLNDAKVILANEVCTLCHGPEAAKKAEAAAKAIFAKGGSDSNLPTIRIDDSIKDALPINPVGLLTKIGFASSNKEAKRQIATGAVRINDKVITDPNAEIVLDRANLMKISLGKKRHAIIEFFDNAESMPKPPANP